MIVPDVNLLLRHDRGLRRAPGSPDLVGGNPVRGRAGGSDRARSAGNLTTDAQIAATAVEHRGTVCTADTDFARFTGVAWTNPLVTQT